MYIYIYTNAYIYLYKIYIIIIKKPSIDTLNNVLFTHGNVALHMILNYTCRHAQTQMCTHIKTGSTKELNKLHSLPPSFGFQCQQIESQLLVCRQISLNYTFSHFYDKADSVITE